MICRSEVVGWNLSLKESLKEKQGRGSADGAAQFIHRQKQQSMKNRSKLLF
nr:MAG TPA: hypothetical protein [Caudoviricetes sp.]